MCETFRHAEPPTRGNQAYFAGLLKDDMDKTQKRETQKLIMAMYGECHDEAMPGSITGAYRTPGLLGNDA